MPYPLIARRDLDFMLYDWLKGETLFARPAFADHSRDVADAVLDLSEQLADDLFLPHYKASDQTEPRLDADGVHVLPAIGEALKGFAEAGLFASSFEPALGGVGLPYLFSSAAFSLFLSANIATSAYVMLTVANARLIATFGSAAQRDRFAAPQIEGRWFGTMCLSEPQAGSSLAETATRGEPDGEDALGQRFRLFGTKMWISGGDQDISENIVHLVLAKTRNGDGGFAEGVRALSLFIVPKILPDGTRNDVQVGGLNHKMGYRGTANCLLNFGDQGGAVGWLVGAPGDGLRQMFLMMNEARINVGLGAAALAYRGYQHALQYAQERRQGRAPGVRGGAPIAIIEHADVKQMLLAQKAYAEGALGLCLYCALLIDQPEDKDATELLGLLTPIAKTWPSEYGLAANDLAIQVHGGYGYTRDFDVEQLYRDNRLNPIHEGTTGVQAMDLLGRKLLRGGGAGYDVAKQRVEACCEKALKQPELAVHVPALRSAWLAIDIALAALRDAPVERAFDNATPFLRAFGHAVVAWLWLDQALAAHGNGREAGFNAGKRRACRFFFEFELPKIAAWLQPVTTLSDVAASAAVDQF